MGSSVSTSITSRGDLYKKTEKTRIVMDKILEYSLKELNMQDFLLLSNPNECKKYVLFFSNTLYKHFHTLQLMPMKDPKGVILFDKISDLTTPPSDKEVKSRQSLCLIISYYYVRIFQIYGALALTVMDDITFMSDTGMIGYTSELDRKGAKGDPRSKMEQIGGIYEGGIYEGGIYVGGAYDIGKFDFLQKFLEPEDKKTEDKGYLTKYVGNNKAEDLVYFKKLSIMDPNKDSGIFYFKYEKMRVYANITISITKNTSDNIIVLEWKEFEYYKKDALSPTKIPNASDSFTFLSMVTIVPKTKNGTTLYEVLQPSGFVSVNDYLKNMLGGIMEFLRNTVKDISTTRVSTPSSQSEVGTDDRLKIGKLRQDIIAKNPAHCIARALQLIKSMPFDGKVISAICSTTFFDKDGRSSRRGIPHPGDTLDYSPGLVALEALFHNSIEFATPKVTMGKGDTFRQYKRFMADMMKTYEGAADNAKLETATLSKIKNQRDKNMCKGRTTDIVFPESSYASVKAIVNEMFMLQYTHSVKCEEYFRMLFAIKDDQATGQRTIGIHPSIIDNGFPAIEKIAEAVREHLMRYYSLCEYKYATGMKIVLDSSEKPKNSTITAAQFLKTVQTTEAKQSEAKQSEAKQVEAKANQAKANQTKADQTKADQAKIIANAKHVIGLVPKQTMTQAKPQAKPQATTQAITQAITQAKPQATTQAIPQATAPTNPPTKQLTKATNQPKKGVQTGVNPQMAAQNFLRMAQK
jgi:hypothetical protein